MAIGKAVLAALSLSSVLSAALPSLASDLTHVIHEKREVIAERWVKRDRVAPSSWLPMRIGLVENTANAEQHLLDVSDPASPNYGKYWSMEDVITHFQPSEEAVEAVHRWLVEAGIARDRITHSDNKGWLAFHATSQEAENLLRTEFHEFEDTVTGGVRPACDYYHVPEHIQHHIDYITPGTLLIAPTMAEENQIAKRSKAPATKNPLLRKPALPFPKLVDELKHCDLAITPICIQALYEIPPAPLWEQPNPDNALGIYEARSEKYAQKDLNLFFRNFTPYIPQGTHPSLRGAHAPGPTKNISKAGSEVDLDLQLAYPLVYPQKINIIAQKGLVYEPQGPETYEWSFNTFHDSMDGSKCTPDGSKGKLSCKAPKIENVISTSYGDQEVALPYKFQVRRCNTFLKYGLQGVTFLFASGDAGVGNYPRPFGFNNPKTGCLGPKGNIFNPTAPSNCPYVTAVGASKVYPGSTVFQQHPESAVFDPVGHPFLVNFSSGGGFSNIFPIPSYQKSAVEAYLTNHKPPYPSYAKLVTNTNDIKHLYANTGGIYNTIGRGYPDVAANGDNSAICTFNPDRLDVASFKTTRRIFRASSFGGDSFFNFISDNAGKFKLSGGTSASAPIFASVINRIVEERLRIGKGPLGFINPTLYANPYVLNDIINGTNPGCFTKGFKAVKGWDPVNGLGTPNFPRMLELFLNLP